jgi:hypothetical protein
MAVHFYKRVSARIQNCPIPENATINKFLAEKSSKPLVGYASETLSQIQVVVNDPTTPRTYTSGCNESIFSGTSRGISKKGIPITEPSKSPMSAPIAIGMANKIDINQYIT